MKLLLPIDIKEIPPTPMARLVLQSKKSAPYQRIADRLQNE